MPQEENIQSEPLEGHLHAEREWLLGTMRARGSPVLQCSGQVIYHFIKADNFAILQVLMDPAACWP